MAVVNQRARMRTAVVGAGVIGLSTAYALLRHGSEAICFDTGRPMAARSTGSSRIFRLAHGVPGLVSYAAAAREWWADWSHRAGTRLLGSQGLVVTGDLAKDWAAAMAAADVEHMLVDDTDSLDLPIRSVQGPALVDPSGGVIDAAATGRFLRAAVGDRVRSEHVHRLEVRDDEVIVHASDGRHSVDRVVVAAGRGTMELAAQVGVYLPTELAHHARFTFQLEDPDAAPPCWIDRTEGWRPGVTTYQHPSGRGRWSIGMAFGTAEVAWERGRDRVVRESRELVTEYVREELPGVGEEIVEEVYCDYPPGLGDGVHTATTGPVTVVWGNNLFKHAPAVGESLATAAVNEVTPHIPG